MAKVTWSTMVIHSATTQASPAQPLYRIEEKPGAKGKPSFCQLMRGAQYLGCGTLEECKAAALAVEEALAKIDRG